VQADSCLLTYFGTSGTSPSFSKMATSRLAVFATDLREFIRLEHLAPGA
jgi:hypothetical protein